MNTQRARVCVSRFQPVVMLLTALSLLVVLALPVSAQNNAAGASAADAPQVKVSRKDIAIDETLGLEILLKRGGTPTLDTQRLEEDFEIIGRSTSTRTEIVNGRAAIETALSLMLRPRREGRLTIPPFEIDNVTTSQILINVTGAPQSAPEGARLTAEIVPSSDQAFVNEQLILTLRVTYAPKVGRLNGDPLKIEGAYLSEAIAERRFTRGSGANERNVIEIDYALFPSETGEIVIAPRNYGGVISVSPTRENNFQRGQRILSRTDRVRIAVVDPATDPVASQHSPWLPAREINATTEWSTDPAKLTVGEPVTRTVTVQAHGQRAAAIPPLAAIDSADIKQYSEQPTLSDNQTDTGVIGTRVQTSALVPVKAGDLTLPEQRIRWFDTAGRAWREAVIPATTLSVSAGASTGQNALPLPGAGVTANAGAAVGGIGATRASITEHSWLTAVLGGTTLLFALSTLMLWQRVGRIENGLAPGRAQEGPTSLDADGKWREVQAALRSRQPHSIRQSLLQWARATRPSAKSVSLGSLAASLNDDTAASVLRRLDASLYSKDAQPMDFDELTKAAESLRSSYRATDHASSASAALPALYRP